MARHSPNSPEPLVAPPALPRATVIAARKPALLAHDSGAPAGAPSLGRMVADGYHAVASQLGQVRLRAQQGEIFDPKEAQTLRLLVQTLAQLHDIETKRDLGDHLRRLSDDELAALAARAGDGPNSGG